MFPQWEMPELLSKTASLYRRASVLQFAQKRRNDTHEHLIASVSQQLRNVRCDHFCRFDLIPAAEDQDCLQSVSLERAAEIEPTISGIRSLNWTIKFKNTTIKTTSCGHQTI